MIHQCTIQPNELNRIETLYHNANGYLGIRNSPEEGHAPGCMPGCFLNGFYESTDLYYAEKLYGFAETKQVMVNLPSPQNIRIFADGREFGLFSPETEEKVQLLDTEKGITQRKILWNTCKGKLRIDITRMASFVRPNLFLMKLEIASVDYEGRIELVSSLEKEVSNHTATIDDPRVSHERLNCLDITAAEVNDGVLHLSCQTKRSKLRMDCLAAHVWQGEASYTEDEERLSACFRQNLTAGQKLRLNKICVFTDSLRFPDPAAKGKELLGEYLQLGEEALLKEQESYLKEVRATAFPILKAPSPLPEALDFDLYELLQSTGSDGICSVAAKGLSGEGYEGHVFWDCESYVFPFFLWTQPEKAKGILRFRIRLLPKAKEHARSLGVPKGAVYPWRTISGSECSPYYPSGSAQYHINGDIAYAFLQYWYNTQDTALMLDGGAEVLVEMARAWLELGHMEDNGFHIDCVTGPDEYTCLVNNNYYTNAVARYNLIGAADVVEKLMELGIAQPLLEKCSITPEELKCFRQTGLHMYLPRDEKLGISAQDDSFLSKKRLDFKSLPKEDFPLLMHYHPLFLYRHQVCKQADTVLAHLLFPELEDEDTKRRSWDYYNEVTTHDSSLSICVYGMMAARLGNPQGAVDGFEQSATLDLLDTHGNTRDGLHTASMGGAYLCLLKGFAGMELGSDGIRFDPKLPEGWDGFELPFSYRGERQILKVYRGKEPIIVKA